MSDGIKLQNVDGNLYHEGEPLMIFEPNEMLDIKFHVGDRAVGHLWCGKDSKLQFDGDMEESAERLFTLVRQLWDRHVASDRIEALKREIEDLEASA